MSNYSKQIRKCKRCKARFTPLFKAHKTCCIQGVKATFWETWHADREISAQAEKVREGVK